DQERARVLRMALAADLAAGWVDSARARLGRAGPWADRERDLWVLMMHDVGLPALGDWERAAARLAARSRAVQDSDVTAHWALARRGWTARATRPPWRGSPLTGHRCRRASPPTWRRARRCCGATRPPRCGCGVARRAATRC